MSDTSTMVFIDPAARVEIRALDPGLDEDAAGILAAATGADTIERGREVLGELCGLFAGGDLVAVYGLRRASTANEVTYLAVKAGVRRKGYGRACLRDALRRSGQRPLVAETDEGGVAFYKACGFKLVGRRTHPSGTVRYRLGWHAPGLRFKGGSTAAVRTRP
ncbi:MAG: GNAT family N-acetyltransferase [Chloroflexia bacterium]|nr:GNAT family N-acetyltransferase [Chloroflexia bacterium]